MSETHDREAKLIAETFHADWSSGRPAEFARAAAAHARRRHVVRRTVATAAACAAIALVGIVTTLRKTPASAPAPRPPSFASVHGYEIISDAELLSQLHDRPLLVVKNENGAREFV